MLFAGADHRCTRLCGRTGCCGRNPPNIHSKYELAASLEIYPLTSKVRVLNDLTTFIGRTCGILSRRGGHPKHEVTKFC